MMQQVYQSFPNNVPITAICIVEDPSKCPPEFKVVKKTHDQDSDADLWRDYSLFARPTRRYLCFSKSEAIMDYIVESISVINDKDNPPEGFSHIPRTVDRDSKAWRKKQLCYSYVRRTIASSAVTDIILLAKTKKAPEGFSLAGDINGITVAFKTTSVMTNGFSSPATPAHGKTNLNGVYPSLSGNLSPGSSNGDYVNLVPMRPAPTPPPRHPRGSGPNTPNQTSVAAPSYNTLSGHLELEGIPFVLHPSLNSSTSNSNLIQIPTIKAKAATELDREYYYDFKLERETST